MTPTTTKAKGVGTPEVGTLPPWFLEYQTAYSSGAAHMILLHGDVYGTHTSGPKNVTWLQETFIRSNTRDILLTYDLENGITFFDETVNPTITLMREKAKFLLDGVTPQPTAQQAAMASMRGGSAPAAPRDPFAQVANPMEALRLIEQLLLAGDLLDNKEENKNKKAKGRIVVCLNRAELIVPAVAKNIMTDDQRVTLALLLRWASSTRLAKAWCPIFLLSTRLDELHADLRASNAGTKAINIPPPTTEDRLNYITRYLAKRAESGEPIELVGLTPEDLANMTAGLSNNHLEEIFLYGITLGGVTREMAIARKNEMIATQFSEIAESLEPLKGGFKENLGGMRYLTEWAERDLIGPLRNRSKKALKGVLLVGPPGTGKTFFVSALAAEVGFNVIRLDLSKITSKWVGESESNMRALLDLLRAMTPVICVLDEADRGVLGNETSGNSVVGPGLLGQLLQFLSDPTLYGEVLFVMISNNPRNLDAALRRSGRMDAIIPVLLPDTEARADILRVQARLEAVEISDEAIVEASGIQTENYNAADLRAIILEAERSAIDQGHARIEVEDMQEALYNLTPDTPSTARYYTEMALEACNNKRLLPPKYRKLKEDPEALSGSVTQEGKRLAALKDEREGRPAW